MTTRARRTARSAWNCSACGSDEDPAQSSERMLDEVMLGIWNVAVEETRELLEGGAWEGAA